MTVPTDPDSPTTPTTPPTVGTTTTPGTTIPPPDRSTSNPAYQAYLALWVGFIVAPILAGLDKFVHLLVPEGWQQYLAPAFANLVGGAGHTFMLIVGVIEVIAGIGVAIWPRIFGYVVSAWLLGIIVNLLLNPATYDGQGWGLDIALRDLGLAIGAFALARLATVYSPR